MTLIAKQCMGSPTCHWASWQENTYRAKYQKAHRANTLCIWPLGV
jgi:hypothetical protein